MKECSICGKEITTLKYYSSNNADVCLDCGESMLTEEIELAISNDKTFIEAEKKKQVYNDDDIQDIDLYYLTQYEGEELEELISELNREIRYAKAYSGGLERALHREVG